MNNYLKIGPIALLNPTDFIDGVIGKDDSGKALKGPDGNPIKFLRVFSVSGRRYDFKEPEAQLVRDFLAGVLGKPPAVPQSAGTFYTPKQSLSFNTEGQKHALPPLSLNPPILQIHKIKETIEKRGTE